ADDDPPMPNRGRRRVSKSRGGKGRGRRSRKRPVFFTGPDSLHAARPPCANGLAAYWALRLSADVSTRGRGPRAHAARTGGRSRATAGPRTWISNWHGRDNGRGHRRRHAGGSGTSTTAGRSRRTALRRRHGAHPNRANQTGEVHLRDRWRGL